MYTGDIASLPLRSSVNLAQPTRSPIAVRTDYRIAPFIPEKSHPGYNIATLDPSVTALPARNITSADRFQRTRDDHSRENAEDYVELIEALIEETGEARAVDLAEKLGVSHVTVSKTIQRLQREGYVTSQPYRSIFLTDKGRAVAMASRARHELVLQFLTALGVPDDVAEIDAEGIEHHVSAATLDAMRAFLNRRQESTLQ
ncbi:MAG: manganese-binding transcriptional regulator MntR [Chlorobia bacterium]|nr:manganese-binding transcriptional regulator MntR [Fimbriimonadaceae bacterium]